jgi:phenylalanyl-tRNA synthetase beta chain
VKVTYSWLKEYVPLAAPAELARQLTLAGLEVESVAPVAPPFSGVVVGEVIGRASCRERVLLGV